MAEKDDISNPSIIPRIGRFSSPGKSGVKKSTA